MDLDVEFCFLFLDKNKGEMTTFKYVKYVSKTVLSNDEDVFIKI